LQVNVTVEDTLYVGFDLVHMDDAHGLLSFYSFSNPLLPENFSARPFSVTVTPWMSVPSVLNLAIERAHCQSEPVQSARTNADAMVTGIANHPT
jgi:hypothetical protein